MASSRSNLTLPEAIQAVNATSPREPHKPVALSVGLGSPLALGLLPVRLGFRRLGMSIILPEKIVQATIEVDMGGRIARI